MIIPTSLTFREFPNFFAAAAPVSTARSIVWLRHGGWRGRPDVYAECSSRRGGDVMMLMCSSRRGGDVMMLMLTRVFARAGETRPTPLRVRVKHAPRPYAGALRSNRKNNVT